MEINLIHREITDEGCYQNIKKIYQDNSKVIMKPSRWRKLRLKQLKKEGKQWSK